ncbi:protein of unknown function [Candidatus Nitrospira inopinata]|uniref:Uncharacterized protein n=1 Tax=Candidatus Nitrospira inopinata TaxID=1715989 RepID=A0A0S4KQH3_9BACT|nr:protein of unknown function [Candidatus Nitrospira inopinata]
MFLRIACCAVPRILRALLLEGESDRLFRSSHRGHLVALLAALVALAIHNPGHHQPSAGGGVATDLQKPPVDHGGDLRHHLRGIQEIRVALLAAIAHLAGEDGCDQDRLRREVFGVEEPAISGRAGLVVNAHMGLNKGGMLGEIGEVRVGQDHEIGLELLAEEAVAVAVGDGLLRQVGGDGLEGLVVFLLRHVLEGLEVQDIRLLAIDLSLGEQRRIGDEALTFVEWWEGLPRRRDARGFHEPLCPGQGLGAGGIDIATFKAPDRKGDHLRVAKAHGAGIEVVAPRFRPKQGVDHTGIASNRLEPVPHRALDATAGKARMPGVSLALDGVVNHANGLARAHVDGAYSVEKEDGSLFKHCSHSLT